MQFEEEPLFCSQLSVLRCVAVFGSVLCKHTHTHTHTHTHALTYLYTHTQAHAHAHALTHAHAHIHTHSHTLGAIYIPIYTYIHTYIHTHIYTYMQFEGKKNKFNIAEPVDRRGQILLIVLQFRF